MGIESFRLSFVLNIIDSGPYNPSVSSDCHNLQANLDLCAFYMEAESSTIHAIHGNDSTDFYSPSAHDPGLQNMK